MSNQRFHETLGYRPVKKDETGQSLCRWCNEPVTEKRRRTWCSDKCVEEYRIATDAQHVRRLLEERDKCVCELCRRDTKEASRLYHSHPHHRGFIYWKKTENESAELRKLLDDFSINEPSKSWWDADHIIPVVKGGGACGLDNYRTLCKRCHKEVTAQLHRELAEKRKLLKQGGRYRINFLTPRPIETQPCLL